MPWAYNIKLKPGLACGRVHEVNSLNCGQTALFHWFSCKIIKDCILRLFCTTMYKALIVWIMLNVTYVSRYLKHCSHRHSNMAEQGAWTREQAKRWMFVCLGVVGIASFELVEQNHISPPPHQPLNLRKFSAGEKCSWWEKLLLTYFSEMEGMCDHKSRGKKALDLEYGDRHTMVMVLKQNAKSIEQRDYMHHCQKEEG